MEDSDLQVAWSLPRDALVDALTKEPKWCPFPWPQFAPTSRADLEYLALKKLKAFWDFGAGFDAQSLEEMRADIRYMFPDWQPTVDRGVSPPGGYMKLAVDGRIFSDGSCDGGYTKPSHGQLPPLSEAIWDQLDLYVKNLVRLDIAERISTIESSRG